MIYLSAGYSCNSRKALITGRLSVRGCKKQFADFDVYCFFLFVSLKRQIKTGRMSSKKYIAGNYTPVPAMALPVQLS